MLSILIVEDNAYKLQKVKEVIIEEVNLKDENIHSASNIKSAKQLLYKKAFDLIILDLVLPLEEDDKDPNAEKGINFLDDIYSNPQIKTPIYIVGLTEFSQLKPQYEENFHKNRNHIIDYKPGSFNWKDQLKNFIWHLIKTRKDFINNPSYDYDIAIVTALSSELKPIRDLNANWSIVRISGDATEYIEGKFENDKKKLRVVAASAPQMGMNAASVLSMKLIYNFRPRFIIMTGIVAGVSGEGNLGDIIIADQTWDGGSGKILKEDHEHKFMPDPKYIPLNPDIKERMRAYQDKRSLLNTIWENCKIKRPDTMLNLRIGPVVSVAGVIQNDAVIRDIQLHNRKLIGLEMESYGVFYAASNCTNPKPIPISIKSITDFADSHKSDTFQEYAAFTSANFMFNFALEEL